MVKRRGVRTSSCTERKHIYGPIDFYSTLPSVVHLAKPQGLCVSLSDCKFCLNTGFPGYFEP